MFGGQSLDPVMYSTRLDIALSLLLRIHKLSGLLYVSKGHWERGRGGPLIVKEEEGGETSFILDYINCVA